MQAGRASTNGDYTLRSLLLLCALAALPTAFLTWVMVPILAGVIPWPPALLFWLATLVGLLWQFGIAVFLLRRERVNECFGCDCRGTGHLEPGNGGQVPWVDSLILIEIIGR